MTERNHEYPRQAFGRWLQRASSGLTDAALQHGPLRHGDQVKEVLLALRDDTTELPPALRKLFGPLRPPTYDDATRLLLWARHAPTGPRCRSFRAALYLIQRLEAPDVEDADIGRHAAPA